MDYGSRFFEKASSDDSDMHHSDDEFAFKQISKRQKK